ncbi:DUF2225 domain-containing protein [Bacillus sp. FJAT-45350]|uniref:DUF2225 domain-containing protein n=1 Tax=Bacillus sp. FJAT-45350 TaxID=2011014 RepID=UPI000BB8C3BE|nr:DUF2225 domain-containing protein [Bacillus sp. FJAT-45350]
MSQEIEPFYDKEHTCLLCNERHTSKKLRSRFIRVDMIDTDFHTTYKNPEYNPALYEIIVCPKCGYAFSDMFSNNFPPGAEEAIYEQVSKRWLPRDFGDIRTVDDAIETYKLGIVAGTLKKEKHIVMAGLCLRLAWLYRMKEEEKQEMRFLRLSLNYYKSAYEQSDFLGTQMSEIKLLYLLGELSRRAGNEQEAVRYFSMVIEHKSRSFETKTVEMAREQWYVIRNKEEE